MPRRMSVWPVAIQTRLPEGTGIKIVTPSMLPRSMQMARSRRSGSARRSPPPRSRQARVRLPASAVAAHSQQQPGRSPGHSPSRALAAAIYRQGWCKHQRAAQPRPPRPLRSPPKSAPALRHSNDDVARRPSSMSSDPCCAASLAHKADLAAQHRRIVRHDKAAATGGIRFASPLPSIAATATRYGRVR
jgi:hypothetical protein